MVSKHGVLGEGDHGEIWQKSIGGHRLQENTYENNSLTIKKILCMQTPTELQQYIEH